MATTKSLTTERTPGIWAAARRPEGVVGGSHGQAGAIEHGGYLPLARLVWLARSVGSPSPGSLVLEARPAQATHLLGGEMSYRYLDANGPAGNPFRYEITVTIYSNGLYTIGNPNGIAPYLTWLMRFTTNVEICANR